MSKEPGVPESVTPEQIPEALSKLAAGGPSAPRAGRDPVNQPMINNWVEAIGDTNPIYVDDAAARAAGHPGIVAPPAMAQVWTMNGLHGVRTADDPLGLATQLLDDAGYTSVVGTNCEQTYHRYLRPGEEVTVTSRLSEFKGPKRTGLGDGWFLTFTTTWCVGDEVVTEMLFRILKFAPGTVTANPTEAAADQGHTVAPADRVGPVISRDTEFFWAGTEVGELRIQRLPDGTLRHPPVPALWQDKSELTDYVVAAGTGTVFSFVVHHAPKVPGRDLPFVVALVELDEGVRMLGELRGIDPAEVSIDLPVRAAFEKLTDGTVLPYWQATR
ncbi:bifunctional MaoC family dehydratase N-terminal/OB-fold nucleic acid binding domain-containing protein [Nocardia halotolerans]|uniref:Bifunctional MaoC family dehydratase N-terminal/OB-fold nucleic acid binding domain-containing protein n=1 Tax=Nocardia halotolerans TaxID=1755878 RepID=A0ABV8VNA7_9NOCA